MDTPEITITLTPGQAARVFREVATANRDASPLMGALLDIRLAVARAADGALDDTAFGGHARSLFRSLLVLTAFPSDGTRRTIKEVAATLGVSVAAVSRHAASLSQLGLLEHVRGGTDARRLRLPI